MVPVTHRALRISEIYTNVYISRKQGFLKQKWPNGYRATVPTAGCTFSVINGIYFNRGRSTRKISELTTISSHLQLLLANFPFPLFRDTVLVTRTTTATKTITTVNVNEVANSSF